jgi:hypothetical protein
MSATYRQTFDASGNLTRIKDDFAASGAPAVTDDFATGGWVIGSLWYVPSTNTLYIAESVGTGTAVWVSTAGSGGGAPTTVNYLVGTADGGLSAEIVVGTTPGGELGGTWASPTVDATHAGSTHSAASDTHVADTSAAHVASSIGFTPVGSIAATDVQAAIAEVASEAGAGTSVATDGIWAAAGDIAVATGNDTAAVLPIGAVGGAVSRLNGVVAWNSGTSNPTGATGDRYWRSDLGLEIFYDGTRWLCVCQHILDMPIYTPQPYSATFSAAQAVAPTHDRDIRVTKWRISMRPNTTNTGAAFWTAELFQNSTSITTVNTSAATVDVVTRFTADVNANYSSTVVRFQVNVSKTGAPGVLDAVMSSLYYRFIVT